MLAVGGAIIIAGYGLVFWGFELFSGGPASLADLMIPGHFARKGAPAQAAPQPGAQPQPAATAKANTQTGSTARTQ